MNFEEYFSYDALGLAELVRTNQISESELLEVTIEICNQIVFKYFLSFFSR